MDPALPPPATPRTTTEPACQRVAEQLCTLHTLLRLIDPASPFQPILLVSVDITAWLAVFGRAARDLDKLLRDLPDAHCRRTLRAAGKQFLRLAETMSHGAELHAFPSTGYSSADLPEIPVFQTDTAVCREDADAIEQAMSAASQAFDASARHRKLLCTALDLAAGQLKRQLEGPGGLLRLMNRRCRASRPFRHEHAPVVERLKQTLASLPDPVSTPWHKCRHVFATLHHHLDTDLLPRLGALARELGTGPAPASAGKRKTQSLQQTTLRNVSGFLETHGLARSLDAGLTAVQYHALFRCLLADVTRAFKECDGGKDVIPTSSRLIDELRRLGPEVVNRDLLASWHSALPDTEPYTTEVVLAALDQLERPPEDEDRSSDTDRWVYGISEADLAGRVRGGRYAGADPLAEASKTRAAETKRVGRTLQHLRRVGAAFHDRRQWTPALTRNARSTRQRQWAVNPLLALLPQIAARREPGKLPAGKTHTSATRASRPPATRRNRGTRPKARG